MPFTACHAAIAAPLARRGLVLSALVIGCMAPDFEFFLRLSVVSRWGHTPAGVLWFSLPVGFAVLWLFHGLLKRPLMALLPPALQDELAPAGGTFRFGPPRRFALVVVSLLIGIMSHVVIDAFTHETGPAVEGLPWLRIPVPVPFFAPQPVYHLLQHGLSLALGLILLAQGARFLRHRRLPFTEILGDLLTGPAPRVLLPLAVPAVAFGVCYGCTVVPELFSLQLHCIRRFSAPAFAATGTALMLELIGFAWMSRLRLHPRYDFAS